MVCHYLGYGAAVAAMIALFLVLSVSSFPASFGSRRVLQKEMKPGRNGCRLSCDLIASLKGLSGAFGHRHYSSKVGCCVVGLLVALVLVLWRELRPLLVFRLVVVVADFLFLRTHQSAGVPNECPCVAGREERWACFLPLVGVISSFH